MGPSGTDTKAHVYMDLGHVGSSTLMLTANLTAKSTVILQVKLTVPINTRMYTLITAISLSARSRNQADLKGTLSHRSLPGSL